jgi:CheY-like chemotaxis protein
MPEMNGYEATRRIIEKYADNKPVIIALTANALTGDREKMLAKVMDDYISKPYKMQDIKDVIQKWQKKLLNKL